MDVEEAIKTRRSIRKYKEKRVPGEYLDKILKAGMCGPSAVDQRPWHFIVITDKEILSKIPEIHPFGAMIAHAPLAIVVCGDTSVERFPGFWIQDCAIASQNILLTVHSLGLGAVWTGIYPLKDRVEGLKKLLDLPENIVPLSVIPIGYPAEKSAYVDRFDSSKIHKDGW